MARDGQTAELRWLRGLLARYECPLLRYAARLVGDADLARDVVQDVFIRLCRADRERIGDHAGEWLFTVCRNRALDVRRKETRMRQLDDASIESRVDSRPAPSAVVERREAGEGALRLLAGLPEKQQEALRLKFQGGLSYKEIAGVLGTSIGNVGFLIHTGLKTIRTGMGEVTE